MLFHNREYIYTLRIMITIPGEYICIHIYTRINMYIVCIMLTFSVLVYNAPTLSFKLEAICYQSMINNPSHCVALYTLSESHRSSKHIAMSHPIHIQQCIYIFVCVYIKLYNRYLVFVFRCMRSVMYFYNGIDKDDKFTT